MPAPAPPVPPCPLLRTLAHLRSVPARSFFRSAAYPSDGLYCAPEPPQGREAAVLNPGATARVGGARLTQTLSSRTLSTATLAVASSADAATAIAAAPVSLSPSPRLHRPHRSSRRAVPGRLLSVLPVCYQCKVMLW